MTTYMRPLANSAKQRKDHTGQTIHHLTITGDVDGLPVRGVARRLVKVRCNLCNTETTKILTCILQGLTKSCGCLRTRNMRALRMRNPMVKQ